MKKIIICGIACAAALFGTTSCNQGLLDIPQKGVIAYENFYKTDEDAESALLSAYAKAIEIDGMNGSNTPSWNVVSRAGGDELYWGGSKKEDAITAQEINEFRTSFTNNNNHVTNVYKAFYAIIYRCNLVIDNFYGEDGSLADTPVKKRCVAEARVLRAWAHFNLAIIFYNPPLVDHVLEGDARPVNADHDAIIDWVISEYETAIKEGLPVRKGTGDKDGAIRLTEGACYAFLGKAQVFKGDYAGAKTSLKKVIDSGNYALTPTAQLGELFHRAGDGNPEKVFEFNIVDNENISKYSAKYHYQRNQSLYFRQMKTPLPAIAIQNVGWGNNMGPTEKFVTAMLENEPNSARRKTWFISYEELITEYEFVTDKKADGTMMTKEEKLMDPNRGLELKKYNDLYCNCGYFWVKFLPLKSDLINNDSNITDENRIIMRYAEVLLLYAEACAQTGDADGLKYLNMIQERAGAPKSATLTLDAVKKEKWFELAWEGQRFFDLVRWGDAAKELAFKGTTENPYLTDEFYEYGTLGAKQTGKPHKAVVLYKDDGFKGAGFKSNHNEYFPIPYDVLELNDQLKQNPYWAQ